MCLVFVYLTDKNDTDVHLDCGCRSQCKQVHYETNVFTSVFPVDLYRKHLQKYDVNVTGEFWR